MSATSDNDIFTTWVSETDQRGVCLVCLCGELDASSVPRFLSDMKDIISRRLHVVMDVHLLEYVDSSGVAAILSAKLTLERTGRQLCLAGTHGLVSKVLQAVRVDRDIASFEDVSGALAYLSNA